jgi:translation elongation factor P/translation initiation factor 5A
MTKKKAIEIKKEDNIKVAGKSCSVQEIEVSDIGKQGSKKVRIVAKTGEGEDIVIIRPEAYPIDVE